MKRHIAILGSTGSIGTQTLDIIRANPEDFEVYAITAGRNADLLIQQAIEFAPRYAVIADESQYSTVAEALSGSSTQVLSGAKAIEEVVTHEVVDLVITAMVGYSGLRPTLAAVRHGKTIGLANKETLVVAGELIMPLARQHGARIIPVDSEHSAIYQCLIGEEERFERLILTASGGPFRTYAREDLEHVRVDQALKHPNWVMGAKVTIDSASLMNKGFEMMEAKWLFDCDPGEIDVLVHPQSIIHSMVQFRDGVVKAQLGIPDMRLPISYALGLTRRIPNDYPRYDFLSQGFTFELPDTERFPNLALAYRAVELAGNAPCVLNAANEVAVAAFLCEQISFTDMSRLIAQMLDGRVHVGEIDLDILEQTDAEVRRLSWEWVKAHQC
ncbi:1-deoxy-D-xylulose-5-phosphate reductoisomerase [Porphyromonas sp. COT-290 OH3588]|uniref:1-deoxy-D-xylulose-5-phosphate reductoisomerase n=1 Tax=Porphyromonas sp. COT-290 OH3588 TaxID=1515617 RepID=UPI00052C6600|nr:1-deoxy-D-xylulose-5-phosphate reductoisomerase [Porphyromonas sp. COT-290 OH3588]KGN97839.1 1-deoxy-D-xylulose 5-phosphate reductoisomerase [Porphyromonas sp. COT-290 OH3588]